MAWLTQFLLGRPTYELTFDVNPSAMKIVEEQILASNRTLSGRRKKWVFCNAIPTIQIDSKWLTMADRNAMQSLLSITDTPLSFQVRGAQDFQMTLEYNSVLTSQTVTIQQNSATRLSAAIVAAGGASVITVTGVFQTPNGTGTNYYTGGGGGSYNDANYTITLGTALPNSNPVYVTYTYLGWLVHMDKMPYSYQGGWIDRAEYNGWELVGA